MADESKTLTTAEILAQNPDEPTSGPAVLTTDQILGKDTPSTPSVVPDIPDTDRLGFLKHFGDYIYAGFGKGSVNFQEPIVKLITGPDNAAVNAYFGKAREEYANIEARAQSDNPVLQTVNQLIGSLGSIGAELPVDVMTGAATKAALVGRVLPQMEALLTAMPDFVLGSGWKGMVDGITSTDGGPIEKAVESVIGSGETMAINTLFANAGVGLKGIGKMASLGLAESYYNAAKQGRLPTTQEITDSTTQAAMMGVVFTALPHLVEGTKVVQEKNILRAYYRKIQDVLEPKEVRPYSSDTDTVIKGEDKPKIDSTPLQQSLIKESVKGGESLYHEKGNLDFLNAYSDASGLNVSTDSYLALGQSGKGVLYEFDKEKLLGDRGSLRAIKKPATEVIGSKEFVLIGGAIHPNSIKSITIKKGTLLSTVDRVKIANSVKWGELSKEVLDNGDIKYSKLPPKEAIDPSKLHTITSNLLTDERIRPEIRESLAQPFLDLLDARGDIAPQDFKLGQWKDRSKLRMMRETMERNIENVAGKDGDSVKLEITEKIKENETYRHRWETELNRLIQGDEMWNRGVRPNTIDSTLTMRFGEGRMTEAELQAASPKNWQNIKSASEFSRSVYDSTLNALNTVRERYGYEPIAKRADYFRHFQEISYASQLFGNFLGGEKPPTSIAGVINHTKYGKPFTATELKRTGAEFKEDAVLALQNYVKSVGPQLFHIDSVQRVRTLERYIRTQALISETAMKEGRPYTPVDLSNFTDKLAMYGDFLAGQPTDLTRWVNRNLDKPFVAGVRAIQRNAVLNMIGGNLSAAFMNLLPMAQQVATTNPKYVVKGAVTSLLHLQREMPFEFEGARSEFYDRRYSKGFLPSNWMESVVDKGFVLPNFMDRMMVQSLISGKYFEGREQGLNAKDAMKAADNYAVRIVTDRTKGQVPQLMSEPDLALINRFQVEINNLWSWLAHDVPAEAKGKLAGTVGRMAVFALASMFVNNVYEKMMGRRPQLDFLYILGTLGGITKAGENRAFLERLKPAAKDLVGNVPFGNLFVEGGRFPISSALPDMNVILEDPEHKALSEFTKPLFYALPFGSGGQARKSIEGLQAWSRGYVATPSGNMRYEVQKDFFNFVRGFLFGKNAFPEAVRYWNQPKSER